MHHAAERDQYQRYRLDEAHEAHLVWFMQSVLATEVRYLVHQIPAASMRGAVVSGSLLFLLGADSLVRQTTGLKLRSFAGAHDAETMNQQPMAHSVPANLDCNADASGANHSFSAESRAPFLLQPNRLRAPLVLQRGYASRGQARSTNS